MMENYIPGDSEGEVYFRKQEPNESTHSRLSRTSSIQSLSDNGADCLGLQGQDGMADVAQCTSRYTDAAANTSPLVPVQASSDMVLSEVTGVLKAVVAELRDLKQAVPQYRVSTTTSGSPRLPQHQGHPGQGDYVPPRCQGANEWSSDQHVQEMYDQRNQGYNFNFNSAEPRRNVAYSRPYERENMGQARRYVVRAKVLVSNNRH